MGWILMERDFLMHPQEKDIPKETSRQVSERFFHAETNDLSET